VIEAEPDLVPAAERAIDVVLRGGVRLVAIAVADHLVRVVAVDDPGRVVGHRLLVAAVEEGREQDLVQPQAGVDEQVLAEDRVPQPLDDVEHVLFVDGRVDDGDRGVVQQPVRLAPVDTWMSSNASKS
jgi:hypothetical protein